MNHAAFLAAWRAGEVRIEIDPQAAERFVAARLLLPFAASAIIGLGIALVLWGWIWTGLAVGASGIVVPRLIRRSARGFLFAHIAADPLLYDDALRAGVLRISAARSGSGPGDETAPVRAKT